MTVFRLEVANMHEYQIHKNGKRYVATRENTTTIIEHCTMQKRKKREINLLVLLQLIPRNFLEEGFPKFLDC